MLGRFLGTQKPAESLSSSYGFPKDSQGVGAIWGTQKPAKSPSFPYELPNVYKVLEHLGIPRKLRKAQVHVRVRPPRQM